MPYRGLQMLGAMQNCMGSGSGLYAIASHCNYGLDSSVGSLNVPGVGAQWLVEEQHSQAACRCSGL